MRRGEKSLRIGVHRADGVVWGPVYRTRLTPDALERVQDVKPARNPAEHDVLSVQARRGRERDVKLRRVRVSPRVGHGERASRVVPTRERLVRERRSEHALAAGAVAALEVPALRHEARDDPVENASDVVQRRVRVGSRRSIAALAQAKEVFARPRRVRGEELQDERADVDAVDLDAKARARVQVLEDVGSLPSRRRRLSRGGRRRRRRRRRARARARKASRTGIESVGWAERHAGRSP